MNKKGRIQDFLIFGIIFIVLVIMVIVGAKVFSSFNEKYQDNKTVGNYSKAAIAESEARYSSIFDWIMITVFVFLVLAVFITMFTIDSHPGLFFVVVVIFVFILVVLAVLGNVFDKFSTSDSMEEAADDFSVTSYLMDNWVFIMMIMGFFAMVLLFAKLQGGFFR